VITKAFLTAGHAIFTVEGMGQHWTYKVTASDDGKVYFVALLTGPDNTSDYTYLGIMLPETGIVRLTKASKFTPDTLAVRVIQRVTARLYAGDAEVIESNGWKLHHVGKCGRCGRPLTTPESVESGIGPICAAK
jgi:hypothetical protein